MNRVSAVMPVVLLLATCPGCIVIPTPAYKSEGFATRQNISSEDVKKIRVDATTREQVLLRYGEPDATFDEQRRFVYIWAHAIGWWFAGAGNSGDAGELPKGYMLEIDFRPDGTVSRCETRTAGADNVFHLQTIAGVPYAPPSRPNDKVPRPAAR